MKFLFILLAVLMHQASDGRRLFKAGDVVMGYTDRRVSVADQPLPPALEAWMQWSGTAESLTTSADHVDPLLATHWNQDEPYNLLCPEYAPGRLSATGCVATAMAQVMAYWRYPAAAFDWDNMLPDYATLAGQSATPEQINAVAQLMLACGQAVDMEYGESSSAYTYMVPVALARDYDYNPGMRFAYRQYMSYDEWAELLRNELRNGRPVIYSGKTSSGGHSFVIDGFNEEGFFHVNWGWGGKSDGWYRFTMLTPPNQGMGGSSTTDGYNYIQGMLIGVAPGSVLSTPADYHLDADSLTLYRNQTDGDSVVIRGYGNYSSGMPFSGDLGVALYHDGVLLRVLRYVPVTRPVDGRWYQSFNHVTINQLTPGETYQLVAVWRDQTRDPEWHMIYGANHAPCGRTLLATSATTYQHRPIVYQGRPVCSSMQSGLLVTGHVAMLNTVWTTDSSEWTGRVALALDNGTDFQYLVTSGMDLRSDRTDTLSIATLVLMVPAGPYTLRAGYYEGNSFRWLPGGQSVTVESRATTDKIYPNSHSFVLSDTLFSAENPILRMDFSMSLQSSAASNALFGGLVTVGVYDQDDQWVLSPMTPVRVLCGKNDTVHLHFEGNVGAYLPDGRYALYVRRRPTGVSGYTRLTSTSYVHYFTINQMDTPVGYVRDTPEAACKFLRNGQLLIRREDKVYNIQGMLVK